jgi:hypothetical protein
MDTPEDTKMLEALETLIRADIPKYERRVKEDSKLMRAINRVVGLFNESFMTRYVTTVYPYVYVSKDRHSATGMWKTLAHEWIHLRTAKEKGVVVAALMYLFPQILGLLAVFSLLGIVFFPAWLNLLWLLCLAPIPAYFRAQEEFKAYAMTLAVYYWRYRHVSQEEIDRVAECFYTSDYYFMWPFKLSVVNRLNHELDLIMDGDYDMVEPYRSVRETIQTIWPPTTSSSA